MMVTKVETETTVVHILFLYYTRFHSYATKPENNQSRHASF